MKLNSRQKKHLRGIAHNLKPVITIGDKGLTEGLLNELESTLAHHELIKIRVRSGSRADRDALIESVTEHCAATLVGRIGNIATLFRAREGSPGIALP
jgi:RNA-binding protein